MSFWQALKVWMVKSSCYFLCFLDLVHSHQSNFLVLNSFVNPIFFNLPLQRCGSGMAKGHSLYNPRSILQGTVWSQMSCWQSFCHLWIITYDISNENNNKMFELQHLSTIFDIWHFDSGCQLSALIESYMNHTYKSLIHYMRTE